MMESVILEALVSAGPVAILAYIIFHMYRKDKKFTETRLTGLLEKDQATREDNTKALTKMIVLLEKINGRE